MTLIFGLYAPAGQFLPPVALGQTTFDSSFLLNVISGLTVTLPVAPSMLLMTFCITVGRAHRNSPVRRSSVYTSPVLPGMPVTTLRLSAGLMRGLIHGTSFGSGATAVSTRSRSNG